MLFRELESRIRNLGGEWACFAVPYWDFTSESAAGGYRSAGEDLLIFSDILGGGGNPDDYQTVNGYSWDVATQEFWVPFHCDAEGDEYPFCSLKRFTNLGNLDDESGPAYILPAAEVGAALKDVVEFADFALWFGDNFNLPQGMMRYNDETDGSDDTTVSYDPLWYLLHSMVSYLQWVWTDCNDYDLIDAADLDAHPEAYSPFCTDEPDGDCGDMQLLDDAFEYNELPHREWSFVSQSPVTVRKSYHMQRWNVVYDLEQGQGFFADAGLGDWCADKLNPEWFLLEQQEQAQAQEQPVDASDLVHTTGYLPAAQLQLVLVVALFVGLVVLFALGTRHK